MFSIPQYSTYSTSELQQYNYFVMQEPVFEEKIEVPVFTHVYEENGVLYCASSTSKGVYCYTYALNNPLIYTDPSGEFIFTIIGALLAPVTGGASLALGIAMDIGGAINLGVHAAQGKINSVGDGLAAYGIGAAAGAIGYATGGAAFAAAGGAAGGAGGFLAGFAGGAIGSAYSMPVQSIGNSLYFGDPMMTNGQLALGIIGGGVLGGSIQGISALANGRTFWGGNLKVTGPGKMYSPSLKFDEPDFEVKPKPLKLADNPRLDNRYTLSTRPQEMTYTTPDGITVKVPRPGINGYDASLVGKTDFYHDYPRILDKTIVDGGIAQRISDRAYMFTAPGTINEVQGVYTVGLNQNGIVYHRCFYKWSDFMKYFW